MQQNKNSEMLQNLCDGWQDPPGSPGEAALAVVPPLLHWQHGWIRPAGKQQLPDFKRSGDAETSSFPRAVEPFQTLYYSCHVATSPRRLFRRWPPTRSSNPPEERAGSSFWYFPATYVCVLDFCISVFVVRIFQFWLWLPKEQNFFIRIFSFCRDSYFYRLVPTAMQRIVGCKNLQLGEHPVWCLCFWMWSLQDWWGIQVVYTNILIFNCWFWKVWQNKQTPKHLW